MYIYASWFRRCGEKSAQNTHLLCSAPLLLSGGSRRKEKLRAIEIERLFVDQQESGNLPE